jgi:hypothetical protein
MCPACFKKQVCFAANFSLPEALANRPTVSPLTPSLNSDCKNNPWVAGNVPTPSYANANLSVRKRRKTASPLQAEIRKSEARDTWLVEGATGKNRLCNDYDVTQQSCRVWAHTVRHSAPKKKSVPSGEVTHPAAPPASATAVAETKQKEMSQ